MKLKIIFLIVISYWAVSYSQIQKSQHMLIEAKNKPDESPTMRQPITSDDFVKNQCTYRSALGLYLYLFDDGNKFKLVKRYEKEDRLSGIWFKKENEIICIDDSTRQTIKFHVIDDVKIRIILPNFWGSEDSLYLISVRSKRSILELMDWKNGKKISWMTRDTIGQRFRLYDENGLLTRDVFSTWEERANEPTIDTITIYE